MSANLRGAGLALVAMALYAGHDAIIKLLGGHIPPLQIVALASGLALPPLAVALWLTRVPGEPLLRPRRWRWVAARTLAGIGSMSCAFTAFTLLPLAQVYALLFATPLLVTLLAWPLLGERIGPWRLGAVALGFAGVLIALRPGIEPLGLGHLMGAGGALFNALAALTTRRIGRSERAAVVLLWPMLGALAFSAPLLPAIGVAMRAPEVALSLLLAGLSLSGTALMIAAYRRGEGAVVAPMQYSQMAWAVLWGLLLFDERPAAATIAGIGLIALSGLVILWRERAARPIVACNPRAAALPAPARSERSAAW